MYAYIFHNLAFILGNDSQLQKYKQHIIEQMRARSKSKKKQQVLKDKKKQQPLQSDNIIEGGDNKNDEKIDKCGEQRINIVGIPQQYNAEIDKNKQINGIVKEQEQQSKVNNQDQYQGPKKGLQIKPMDKNDNKNTAEKELDKQKEEQGDLDINVEQFLSRFQPSKTITTTKNLNLKKNAFGEQNHKNHNDFTKKQNKITKYFPTIVSVSSVSNNTTSLNVDKDTTDDKNLQTKNERYRNAKLEQQKLNELRNLLTSKDQQIQKYRTQKEIIDDKYSKLYLEAKNYRHKSRQIIIKIVKEQAARRRQENAKFDLKLGYFTSDMKGFKEGEEIIALRNSIQEKNQEIGRLEGELRKSKSEQQKNRTKFSIQFLKKQMKHLKKKLDDKEKQLQVYKERIKLAMKEQVCEYCLQGWPLVKDSHGNQRYQSLELLGKGGFGEVYKCFDLEENDIVAIKINNIPFDYGEQSAENNLKHLKREVNTQRQLKHPNIAQIKELLELDRRRIVFVLEYCKGPELSVYLKKNKCIEEKDAKQIIYQIFSALNYLFSLEKKVIHYDLKPSNIIFHNGTVKILDFGLCKLMQGEQSRMDLTSQGAGTYWYLPPETFTEIHSKISSKVDVWSTGVIFFELLYGRRPFANGISQRLILQRNLIQTQAQKLVYPDSNPNGYRISKQAKDFISQCLVYDPDNRLSPSQAFNHPYFKEYQPK